MSRLKRKCPICGKPAVQRHRPFCSGRCADLDLARWFTGFYRVPSEQEPDNDDGSSADARPTGAFDEG